jgi:hypothetical protein
MKKIYLINSLFFLTVILLVACGGDTHLSGQSTSDITNTSITINVSYQNDPIQILTTDQTIQKIKEIEVSKNQNGQDDIVINAYDGSQASFYSFNSCEGAGPSYSIIGSIPKLGIVFLDRTHGCDMGESMIMVSLKDGSQRELQCFDIFNSSQFFISPDNSWLLVSSCDCSMGYSCNMEILSLKPSSSSLLKSVYYKKGVCVCDPINWVSENEIKIKCAVGENESGSDCEYSYAQVKYENGEWNIVF